MWCGIIQVSVAGQNVSYPASAAKISASCGSGYYGQSAFSVYPYRPCTTCNSIQAKCMHLYSSSTDSYSESDCYNYQGCATYTNVYASNAKTNCSVITRVNEFCIKCPTGSTCTTNTRTYPSHSGAKL